MEALKIACLCIAAAIVYGIVHDQITARICVEYFTIFHPPIFHTQSPTLLGIGWGIVATWWVGAFFSVPLILAARAGARPTLRAAELLPSIAWLLASMGVCATLSGITGYVLARRGVLVTDWLSFYGFTRDALPLHGGLVGAFGFLCRRFRWRDHGLRFDMAKAVSAQATSMSVTGMLCQLTLRSRQS